MNCEKDTAKCTNNIIMYPRQLY